MREITESRWVAFRHACRVNRNRVLLLAGAAAVAVVVVVLVILVAGSGGGSSTTTTTLAAPTGTGGTAQTPASIFADIPQHGDTLGVATAPATLTVFEDPQCPYCREWELGALPTVVSEFVRAGRVKIVYRGINILGPNSDAGLAAVYAAGKQNKLWDMADALYAIQGPENSGWIDAAAIRKAALAAGANADAIIAAMPSAAVAAMVTNAHQQASALGVGGTPTFVLQLSLGAPAQLNAPLDASGFSAVLAAALK